MFRHPKYYKELRERNKEIGKAQPCVREAAPISNSDQVISRGDSTEAGRCAPDPGLKQQASTKLVNACIDQREPQAPSTKPQASGFKHK
jgi:hypothetical protein